MELPVDLPHRRVAGGLGFVGVDVHRGSEFGAYATYDIAEHGASLVGVDLDAYDLLVLKSERFGGCGIEVYVTFCGDNAFGKLDLSAGSDELAGGGAGNVAALANGRIYSERACIGKGNLDLTCLSCRPENNYSLRFGKLSKSQ